MNQIIFVITLIISFNVFGRQYIQCSDKNNWDGAVINLDGEDSTLFMTNGVHLPNELRVLKKLILKEQGENKVYFETNEGEIIDTVSIPLEVIGVAHKKFNVHFRHIKKNSGHEIQRVMICFSSIYEDELDDFENSSVVLLRDIGVIGLASHDMFTWDRKKEVNLENGRLDLSTIFDYENGSRWKKGGNPKNAENAPVWSITKRLVNYYKKLLKTHSLKQSRIMTVKYFHNMIKESYERLLGSSFPDYGLDLEVTNVEQAVLRSLHDILPGRVKTFRSKAYPVKSFSLTNFTFSKYYLNEKELDQEIKYFDGDYDEEYKRIKIPFSKKEINLKEVDRKFIEKFSPYNQSEMLLELRQVGRQKKSINQVSFIYHAKELFQKGICSKNKWIKSKIPCF